MSWPRQAAMLLAFVGGVALACAERQAEVDDDLVEEEVAVCLWISGYGQWDDGTSHVLKAENGFSPTVCWCMTEEEIEWVLWEDKQAFIDHELNAKALAECQRVSALFEFDSDPCEENYETGAWRSSFGVPSGNPDYVGPQNWEGLTCGEDGEPEELGCVLGGRRGSVAWLLILAGLLGVRRRAG